MRWHFWCDINSSETIDENDWVELHIPYSLTNEMKSSNGLTSRSKNAVYMFYLEGFFLGDHIKVNLIGRRVHNSCLHS